MNINDVVIVSSIRSLNDRMALLEKNVKNIAKYVSSQSSNNQSSSSNNIECISPLSIENNKISIDTAAVNKLGVVSPDGNTITINNGVLSAKQYSLPTASNNTLGGVKIDNFSITSRGGG